MTTPIGTALRLHHDDFPERLAFVEHHQQRTVVEVELEPGGGTPEHVHLGYDEHFEVLDGVLGVELDGVLRHLGLGESCTAPRRIRHRFVNESDATTRFRVTLAPGARGFIEMQLVFFGLRADGRTDAEGNPRDPRQVATAFGWAGIAPPSRGAALAMRVLRLIARLTGEDRRIRAQYVEPAASRIEELFDPAPARPIVHRE